MGKNYRREQSPKAKIIRTIDINKKIRKGVPPGARAHEVMKSSHQDDYLDNDIEEEISEFEDEHGISVPRNWL